jgi:predicted membrane protein
MKKLMLLGTVFVWCLNAQAQEYKVKFGNSKDRKIIITADNSDMKIEGYDGDEVQIRVNEFEAPPERAKGLKPLYNSAVDNSGIGLSVLQEGNVLTIAKATRKEGKYTLRVPKKVSISFEQGDWQGDNLNISNVEGDLEIKTNNSDIHLDKVTGPVVASTTSGDIFVVYASLEQSKPSSISNISGTVDVTLPANTKANLKMKSITGEIYSDLDLAMPQNKGSLKHIGGGQTVEGSINGGGVEISLKTISDDIYLRKQK